jgi:ring-1,2-phenylacetyl-CoA epoxidase subunit PaaC
MEKNDALFTYLLRLGDSSLILAQRLSEWTGHGPFLEEDLALTNIALDIFGRAKSLLEYAGKIEGKGRSEDDLAFHRDEREYFNLLITEQKNGDYAKTILRQAFVDAYEHLVYGELAKSKDETLAGIAQKSVKEIAYHRRHCFSWVKRFGNGTEESKQRLKKAFIELWPYTGELFAADEVDIAVHAAGLGPDLGSLKDKWERDVATLLAETGIEVPSGAYMHSGSRKGIHTENLGFILAEMQALPRAHPEAKW